MKYRYTKAAPDKPNKPWIRRPLVSLVMKGTKRDLRLYALLDSGADCSLFHVDVAEVLGIDLAACDQSKVAGIEGVPQPCYQTEVVVEIGGIEQATIPVQFWERQPVSLLGQLGFFDQHRIKFERDHDVFEITPVKA